MRLCELPEFPGLHKKTGAPFQALPFSCVQIPDADLKVCATYSHADLKVCATYSDADLKVCAKCPPCYRLVRCSILPVLSPICSDGTPILSSSVRYRLVIGVPFG